MDCSQGGTRLDSLVLVKSRRKKKNMSRENKLSAMAAQKIAEGVKPVIAVCIQTLSKERKTESG